MFKSPKTYFRFLAALSILIIVGIYSSDSLLVSSQEKTKAIKVLFIGNSYSFYNDLPGMLEKLAKFNGHNIETKIVARNGTSLKEHWNEEKALSALEGEKWDYVVLQERSSLARDNTAQTLKYARYFDTEIKKAGAKTLFYATPAYKNKTNSLKTHQSYLKLAKVLNAKVVPVGLAFERVYSKLPQIDLHAPDRVHPNPKGTFLATYLFYKVIYEHSPEKLNSRELKIDLDKQTEAIFRKNADFTFEELGNNNKKCN